MKVYSITLTSQKMAFNVRSFFVVSKIRFNGLISRLNEDTK